MCREWVQSCPVPPMSGHENQLELLQQDQLRHLKDICPQLFEMGDSIEGVMNHKEKVQQHLILAAEAGLLPRYEHIENGMELLTTDSLLTKLGLGSLAVMILLNIKDFRQEREPLLRSTYTVDFPWCVMRFMAMIVSFMKAGHFSESAFAVAAVCDSLPDYEREYLCNTYFRCRFLCRGASLRDLPFDRLYLEVSVACEEYLSGCEVIHGVINLTLPRTLSEMEHMFVLCPYFEEHLKKLLDKGLCTLVNSTTDLAFRKCGSKFVVTSRHIKWVSYAAHDHYVTNFGETLARRFMMMFSAMTYSVSLKNGHVFQASRFYKV